MCLPGYGGMAWAAELSLWSSATHPRWCPPRRAIRRRDSRYPTGSARAGSRTGGASRAPHRRAGTRHGATRGIVGAGSRVPGSTGGGRCSSGELWTRCAWRWWQWHVSRGASDLRARVPRVGGAAGTPLSAPPPVAAAPCAGSHLPGPRHSDATLKTALCAAFGGCACVVVAARLWCVLAVFRCAGRCAAVAPVRGRRLYARQGRPVRSVKKG